MSLLWTQRAGVTVPPINNRVLLLRRTSRDDDIEDGGSQAPEKFNYNTRPRRATAVRAPRHLLNSWASVVMSVRLMAGRLPSTVQTFGAWVCVVSARMSTAAACWKKPQKNVGQGKYKPTMEHSRCSVVPIHDTGTQACKSACFQSTLMTAHR